MNILYFSHLNNLISEGPNYSVPAQILAQSKYDNVFWINLTDRRCVLHDVGLFNVDLGRTEDNEYHYRIREAGYKICYSPDINSYQYVRNTMGKMLKQKFANGYWMGKTFWICPRCLENYHFIPLLFLLGIILTSFLYCIGFPLLGNIMWSLYWGLTVIMTIMAIPKCKNNAHLLALPIIFFSLHLSYGLGTLKGIIKL